MSNNYYPTSPVNRIEILDVLRGLSLIGVLIANIAIFSGYLFVPFTDLKEMSMSGLNNILMTFSFYVISGKFYPIFCMLFGIGMYLQFQKHKEKGSVKFFVKRLITLMLIAAVHQTIWPGDVVFIYAIFGFFLIPFKNSSPKTFLILSIIAFVAHFGGYYIYLFLTKDTPHTDYIAIFQYPGVDSYQLLENVQNGGLKGTFFLIKAQHDFVWNIPRSIRLAPSYVLLFALGAYILGSGFLLNKAHKPKYMLIFFPLAILGTFLMRYSYSLRIVDNLFAGLGIICLISFLLTKERIKKGLLKLKPFGRMALTNYIMQSVLCISIFYGLGLGYYGKLPLYAIYFIGISIIFFQIKFSQLWLSKYNYGPVELVWRRLSYGKVVQFKK